MLEITLLSRPPARRADAGGVPDLGQVPELDPRVMTLALEPVIARVEGDRVERDHQVRPPRRPATPVDSRQAPYPPGGPSSPDAVKVNPGRRPAPGPPGGS